MSRVREGGLTLVPSLSDAQLPLVFYNRTGRDFRRLLRMTRDGLRDWQVRPVRMYAFANFYRYRKDNYGNEIMRNQQRAFGNANEF